MSRGDIGVRPHRSCTAIIVFTCGGPRWLTAPARKAVPMCEKRRTHRLQLRTQESRPVHSTDGIRRLRHHGTSLSISTVSLVYPVSPTLRRLQSLMTRSRLPWPRLASSTVKPCLPEPLRGVRWSDPSRPAAGERVTRRGSIASHTVYHGFNAAEDDNCWLRARTPPTAVKIDAEPTAPVD